MDNARLTYVSGGHLLMFDFDGHNAQTLAPSLPHGAYFTSGYHQLYTLVRPKDSSLKNARVLRRYWLLTPADR
jgi:hypothetical protein